MTAQVFQAEVRRRAAPGFSHMVVVTDHASEQMAARKVSRTMVLRVLRRGMLDGRGVRWSGEHGTWTGSVIGVVAGVGVQVVCALPPEGETVVVVTVVNKGEAR
jgi:hypothetical protein